MKNNASLVYNFCLVIGDFLALVVAFVGAFLVRSHFIHTPVAHPIHFKTYLTIFIFLIPFWILIFVLLGLYNNRIYENRFSEAGRLLIGSFVGMLFVIFWNFLSLKPIFPAKLVPIIGFVFGFIFLVIFRNLARYVRTVLFSYRIGLTNVLLIGSTPMTKELLDSLSNSRTSGYTVVGVIGNHQLIRDYPKLVSFPSFGNFLTSRRTTALHAIIQTELYADEYKNREILEFAQQHHVTYRFVPGNSELFVGNIDVELFRSSVPVIAIHQTALFGWGRIIKRMFDVLVGAVACIFALPFMIVTALAILLFDPGPILYRQVRLTRYNREFTTYKFRTIKREYNALTPEQAFQKMGKTELIGPYRSNGDKVPNDPRFSRLGHFLRSASLDELPQLINVLKGDISLVGPRALIPQELALYDKRHTILSVRSGLTGLAQVSGRRKINFEERRMLDLYYVQNWSFWFDLTILARTIKTVLNHADVE
jgi:exopolysaccharide biosynthesis polyprenyl glycosylphosphotransferase